MLEHGGRLHLAASQYGIPLAEWIDLSTGINPNGWPVPQLPANVWQRLPEEDDELISAARQYYQNDSLLAVAGSQAAIQTLPVLRPHSRVGVLHPAYTEHAEGWRRAGHSVTVVDEANIEDKLERLNVLIIINPNNPSGRLWHREQLLAWYDKLSDKGGWLIVDEAFIDVMDHEYSLSALPVRPGLIVLRSIGKFFGLAGIRCGFVIAEQRLLLALQQRLGPWSISRPTRYVAAMALRDTAWQQAALSQLRQQGRRLHQLLSENGWQPAGGCPLFQWVKREAVLGLHQKFAGQGILTRLFTDPVSVRFGLPGDEAGWLRLARALEQPEIEDLLFDYHAIA